ncbi:MAG: hypothetical protein FJY42_15555 [Betaproteobacteria bacterium]|nr:hypothetical protein [Betaproteobacteria bacterium]
MLDAMTVRGLSERTKECYVDAVARLARYYHRSPELLSAPEIEAYLLHLVKDRKLSYSSVNHVSSASRFLFEKVLGRPADMAHLRPPMARVPQKAAATTRPRRNRPTPGLLHPPQLPHAAHHPVRQRPARGRGLPTAHG